MGTKKRVFKNLYNCVLYTRKLYYEYLTPVFDHKITRLLIYNTQTQIQKFITNFKRWFFSFLIYKYWLRFGMVNSMNNTYLMWENPHTKYLLHSPNQIFYMIKKWEMQINWKKRDKINIYYFSYLTCAVNRILPPFILFFIFLIFTSFNQNI